MGSRSEAYLKYLAIEEGEIPEPISRMDYYLHYLAKGGDKEQLPLPSSRVDEYLYQLCMNDGLGEDSSNNGSGPQGTTITDIVLKINWIPPASYSLENVNNTKIREPKGIPITTIEVKQKEGV